MYDCFYVFKLDCFWIFNFLSATDKSRSKNTLTQKRTVFTLRNFLGRTRRPRRGRQAFLKNTLQMKHCVFHVYAIFQT